MKVLNKYLNNLSIYWMYAVNLLLLFISIVVAFFKSIQNSDAASGFFLLIIPMVAAFFIIPQCIGTVLSAINIKIKKYVMLVFIFITSLLSLGSIIISYSVCDNTGIMFWITLIECIILIIMLLLKLALRIEG